MTDPWTCPDCGVIGSSNPERLPPTEFPAEQLAALHQWARSFDKYSRQGFPADKPAPRPGTAGEYGALDFVHWVIQHQRLHSHDTHARNEPAGRPGRRTILEARATAA